MSVRLHLFLSLPNPTAQLLKKYCAKTGLKKNAVILQAIDKLLLDQSLFNYWHPIIVDKRRSAWNGVKKPKKRKANVNRRRT